LGLIPYISVILPMPILSFCTPLMCGPELNMRLPYGIYYINGTIQLDTIQRTFTFLFYSRYSCVTVHI